MADVKMSAIPTATTMATGDLIPFTSAPGGTPVSKNITKENLGPYLTCIRYGIAVGPQMRRSQITIEDGTDAAHIKVTMANIGNGDVNGAQDNIGKDGVTTGVWSLNAAGTALTLLATGITGNGLLPISCTTFYNITGTAMNVFVQISSGTFIFNWYDAAAGTPLDMTSLVDTSKEVVLAFTYLSTE
jgi:hypothetical protein